MATPDEPVQEHVERNIDRLDFRHALTQNIAFTPHQGVVKWFKDDFDQLWVKFSVRSETRNDLGMWDYVTIVFAADRLNYVQYRKRAAPMAEALVSTD